MISVSYKIKFAILGALIVSCSGCIALHGTNFEHDLYRYLVPIIAGGLSGYFIGLMKDKWLVTNRNLNKTNEAMKLEIKEHKLSRKALQDSEEQSKKYLQAIDSMGVGIFIVDSNYHIRHMNKAMIKWFGDQTGLNCHQSIAGLDSPCSYCKLRSVIESRKVVYYKPTTPDGRSFDIICYPIQNADGSISKMEIIRDITEEKHAENLVRDLPQMLMQAQERERQIIACELHDSIAQNLSTLKLYCNRLFKDQSLPESDIKGSQADVSELIDQTITSVRDMAYDLRPPGLDQIGLVHALEVFCEEFAEKNDIIVDFQAAGIHGSTLNSDTQINLYRLVTEGLNNVLKHAAASKAIIRLVGAYPNIILRIEDDGKGFDVKERERSIVKEKRMGLRSMKERVNLLQGNMSIHSQLNKGTKIAIKLPIKDK